MAGPLDFGLHHGLGPYNVHWAMETKNTGGRFYALGLSGYIVGNAR